MLKRNEELTFSKDDLTEQLDGQYWFDADRLNRRPHIRAITDLLLTTEGNFVMTLSSPWGTGKTTFMRMWKAYLESEKHTCVLFNAWQHDYAENPFLTFIAEMSEQLSELEEQDANKALDGLLDGLKSVGKKLFPRLLSLGVKTGLGVSVDFEKMGFGNVGEALTQIMGDSMEGYASEVLEQHTSTKKLVEDFRKSLEAVVKSLGGDSPLFFFVDELDRCKPTYAVELLEAVKHLFETSGIIFVLSLDREQLGHSVKAAYGDGIDADGYLRRFIDLEYRIPEPDKKPFVEHLGQVYGLEQYPIFIEAGGPEKYLDEFSKIGQHYPLRTIEKAFLRGTILMRGLRRIPSLGDCDFFPHFAFLRELNAKEFKRFTETRVYPGTLPADFGEQCPGLNVNKLNIWSRHKLNWKEGNTDLGLATGRTAAYDGEARLGLFFLEHYQDHLIDEIVRLLDLSEQLVPIEEAVKEGTDS